MSARRAIRIAAVVAIAAVAAVVVGVLVWGRGSSPRPRALETGWAATVLTIAGDGTEGIRDGDAARARFSDPFGVAVAADGTIYISDAGDAQRVRRLTPGGTVSTFAGGAEGFADGIGATAQFNTPSGLAIDAAGMLYVADTGNNAIRRIAPDGEVSTLAGDGVAGYRDGPAAQARFNGPVGVAVDGSGRVLVADTYNDRLRAIDPDGSVVTLAGPAGLNTPCGVAIDRTGNIYVADTGDGVVRRISPAGAMTTITALTIDAPRRPMAIAVGNTGHIYLADDVGRILEAAADGATRVVAGSRPGFADGNGADARFRRVAGLAVAAPGRLVAADAGNALLRLVAAQSQRELRAPASPRIAPHFDVERFAWQPLLWPLDPMEAWHEVAGTMGEARGGAGGERFHAGIDVRADEGTPVRAVRDAVVAAPFAASEFGTLVESVRIGAVSYVHVRVGRDRRGSLVDESRFVGSYDEAGTLVGIRVKRGAHFATGEVVGTVNPFNHVHLNIGWPGEEYNPLLLRLVQFEDTVPPTIRRGGVRLFDENGELLKERKKGRLLIHGRVQIVVDAWDQVDGNESRRRLGLYAVGYEVLNADGSPIGDPKRVALHTDAQDESQRTAPYESGAERPFRWPDVGRPFPPSRDASADRRSLGVGGQGRQSIQGHQPTIEFNRLAMAPDAARLVYAAGSGIPFYGGRATRFLYAVTNTLHDGVASPGYWDTTAIAPGDYTLRVHAADVRGNEALANRDVPVTVTGF